MINLINLKKIYSNSVALNIDRLELIECGVVYINGESGAGKTTLINCLAGLDSFSAGEIFVGDKKVENLKEVSAFIFQDFQLFDQLSVYKNLAIACDMFGTEYSRIDDILKAIHIEDIKGNKACDISAGQKQRVAIARALLSDKQILFCDEPLANLDEKNSREIILLLKELSKDRLIIIITHERLDEEVYDQKITLDKGIVAFDSVSNNAVRKDMAFNAKSSKLSLKNRLLFSFIFSRKHKSFLFFSLLMTICLSVLSICTNVLLSDKASQTYNVFKANEVTAINFTNARDDLEVSNPYFSYIDDEIDKVDHRYKTLSNMGLFIKDSSNKYYGFDGIWSTDSSYYQLMNHDFLTLADNQIIVSSDIADEYAKNHSSDLIDSNMFFSNIKFEVVDIFKEKTGLQNTIACNDDTSRFLEEGLLFTDGDDVDLSIIFNDDLGSNKRTIVGDLDSNAVFLYGENPNRADEIVIDKLIATEVFGEDFDATSLGKKVSLDFETVNSYREFELKESKDYIVVGIIDPLQSQLFKRSVVMNDAERSRVIRAFSSHSFDNSLRGYGVIYFDRKDIREAYGKGLVSNSSLAEKLRDMNGYIHSWNPFIIGLGALFALISILLLYYTLKSSINSNKKNLGVLLSQGIDKKRASSIVFLEGLIYTLSSFVISIPCGIGLLFGFNAALKSNFDIVYSLLFYSAWTSLLILLGSVLVLITSILLDYLRLRKLTVLDIIYDK